MVFALGILGEIRFRCSLSVYYIRCSTRTTVTRRVLRCFTIRDIDAQTLQRFELVSYLVAYNCLSSRNGDVLFAAKLQVLCRLWLDFHTNVRHVFSSHRRAPWVAVKVGDIN